MSGESGRATRQAVEAVWRIESARLIGGLVRMVRDVGLAEDLAQEALVTAMERWPTTGIPENPGAWLMATAKNRAIDELRRRQMQGRKHDAIEDETSGLPAAGPDVETAIDENIGDDLLRLMLVACHPVLSTDARVTLTLRLLGGLTTDEIARAFLVSEPTIAQRIVRAKRTLTEARVPFEVPRGSELSARLSSVLEAIYLIFNEGYAATKGDDWTRPELCEDALRLGRILAQLAPEEAEIHGLAALARAEALKQPLGPYALQAAIAGCHARARTAAETEWNRIVALYDALVELTRSPVVELNRAVAVSMAFGPAAGLELVDALVNETALESYHLLPSVRGDLLAKLGRNDEARKEFERAATLAQNARERELLLARARACETRGVS